MNAGGTNYDLLYNPRLVVSGFERIFERWERDSERARASLEGYLDVPYGVTDAEKLDIFKPRGESRGLLMYIHGGYWRSLDKKRFSFVAPALVQAGITVAIPNYALCPAVQVEDIVMQMVQACAWLYRNGANFGAPANRLHLCGHSAGGHLAAMMLACLWPKYSPDLPKQVVAAALSISGLYDLTEIVKVPSVNGDVRLTEKAALRVSPASMPPATDAPLYTAVGEKENEGFHIQNRLIAEKWGKVRRADIPCPGANHFTVLDQLCYPGSGLFRAVLKMMSL
ncbi:MAG TPA: alpha/beta hydrolase [Burkholderiales bacterium]|nr:alpha/beta hydrolase [Burkholderiales bacterium]